MSEWTDEQRALLVECATHATVVTGHDIHDCATELARIIKAYKAQGVDERGRKK